MLDTSDRYRGCLLGLAAGDALGTTLEFRKPGSFAPLTELVGGGPFGLQPGQWTDDTSMALCLGHSLVSCGQFDARDQMARYQRWRREGYMSSTGTCFDIGGTVSEALCAYAVSGNPFSGSRAANRAGNGSIMRLAPVPMFYRQDAELAGAYAELSSRTTHGATTCVDACHYLCRLIIDALSGIAKETLLQRGGGRQYCPEIEAIANGSFRARQPPEIAGTGYVVQSLEAALWAFARSTSFREGALMAVNLGDDADTTGAVYGQLAGAFYGLSGIPAEWLRLLAEHNAIRDLADHLQVQAQALDPAAHREVYGGILSGVGEAADR